LADDKQGLTIFDRLTIFNKHCLDHAGAICLYFIQQLHGFDNAEHIAFLDCLPNLDKGGCARVGSPIKGAYHGGQNTLAFRGIISRLLGSSRCFRRWLCSWRSSSGSSLSGWWRCINHLLGLRRGGLNDTYLAFAFGDLEFRNI